MTDERTDYLWDGRGEADATVADLEAVLGVLRHRGTMPALPPRVPARRGLRIAVFGLTAAAALLLVAGAGWFAIGQRQLGWAVERLAGDPVIDGKALTAAGELRRGTWLETGSGGKARVRVGEIGLVDVDPDTRLQLVSPRGREHRMSLDRGTIHALIWAPPKAFVVDTPSAVATDLGCAYTLTVDEDGGGLLTVLVGWVGFTTGDRESFIPAGFAAVTRPGIGPGTPYSERTSEAYRQALALIDFSPGGDGVAPALSLVLDQSEERDEVTLWHLLTRVPGPDRDRVFDRLASFVPPPTGVTRDGIRAGDRRMLDAWWDALGLGTTSLWRTWSQQWKVSEAPPR